MWNNYLFFETPDNYLVSLDARTGKERWHKEIAELRRSSISRRRRRSSSATTCIVGTGNDLDSPGFLQSFDPETGELQWKFYTVPMKPGDPGLETWPSLDAARHGGGHALAARRLRSGDAARTSSAPAIRRPATPTAAARRATTCSPARLSRVERRHRQDGVVLTRRRRTTRTTGIRRRRRS